MVVGLDIGFLSKDVILVRTLIVCMSVPTSKIVGAHGFSLICPKLEIRLSHLSSQFLILGRGIPVNLIFFGVLRGCCHWSPSRVSHMEVA